MEERDDVAAGLPNTMRLFKSFKTIVNDANDDTLSPRLY